MITSIFDNLIKFQAQEKMDHVNQWSEIIVNMITSIFIIKWYSTTTNLLLSQNGEEKAITPSILFPPQ